MALAGPTAVWVASGQREARPLVMYWGGGGGGGGGYDLFFYVSQKKKYFRGEAQKGLMPDFFISTRKKIRRGGLYPNFLVCTQRLLLRVSECGGGGGKLCPIFSCVLGRGGYTQIFGVYSKNITASVGGGLMPDFFMRTRKLLGRGGGGLYSNFWCVLKEYYGGWVVLC